MKKILITGKHSYIGTSLDKWLMKDFDKYKVDSISVKGDLWKNKDFSQYDVVFHVAGIAHVSTDPKMKDLYYKINRDLTIEVANKAKSEGVKQFIFMSSIIVYGDNKDIIDETTVPIPSDFYGDSKLLAEEGIKLLETNNFNIVIIRPPMIYGKGSKGNYPRLANLAKKTPIFPEFENKRSMLFIDNLCEFLKIIIDIEEKGIFFPQNKEYVNTSEMVKLIGEVHGNKIRLTKVLNPIIRLISRFRIINKVFGNLTYDMTISNYNEIFYQNISFNDSIKKTERNKI